MANTELLSQIISDLPKELIINAKYLLKQKLDSKEPEPAGKHLGADYYHLVDNGNGYWVLVSPDKEIIYFVRYTLIRHNGFRLGRQVLVWNDKTSGHTKGFARFIFFQKLLPNYHALVADQQQTKDGASFWKWSADFAFETNRKVYLLDRLASPNTLTPISSYEILLEKENQIWGKDSKYMERMLVISDKPIRMRTPEEKRERKIKQNIKAIQS